MQGQRLAGAIAVLFLTTGLGAIFGSFVASNELFAGSVYATAAAATVVVFTIALMLFILAGRPSRSWRRTPYW